ncbi:hypothetical protein [Floridanema aerugineum]|uniref:Apea-like HEPN domain-containing protein n=1 Tax=Floridaenema aerugineum BLCC-F46 TaxID=3153654 RepID=A0ABV4X9J5_9CYAN
MQISEREDNNMSLEFGDDELLFEDEFIPDNLIPLPSSPLFGGESNARLEQGAGILRFTQQEEAQNQNRKTIFILWPVYGWRIAAPQIITRQLDFLQLTSLRLARAGVIRHQDQAELMGQHKDCLWNVMMQLKEQNYLDSNGRLTETGKKILSQEGEAEEERTNYGWIFQEATAGELLPYFYTENLRFADPQRSDITEAFQLPWIRQKSPSPNASKVISAIETYRRLLKRIQIAQSTNDPDNTQADICEFTDISELDNLVPNKKDKEAEQLEKFRVRILSQRSQRFYLLVSCTIEGSYDGLFSLRCPFGLPDGFRWVRLLNFAASQCEEGKKLVEHLQSYSREIWKLKQPPHLEPVTVARQVYNKVALEIGQPPNRLWQRVWEEIERVEQSRLLLERGFDEVDTTITRIQRVLEQLMISLLQVDSIPNNIWEAYKRGDTLKQCLRDTVQACGINEIPERILCTKLGAIRNVINGGKDSLRPYVATFLLSASRKSSLHRRILEYLLAENPTFLLDADRIAQNRNQFGAHAGGSHNEPIILVEDLVEKMYQIVRLVLQAWRLTIS